MNAITRTSETGIVRDGFGERSVERRGETASTAIAAQAQAEIQAGFIMAMQRPRDDDDVRARLLKECRRPNFAVRSYYSIPRKGAKAGRLTGTPGRVEGLTVRFAEAAIRISGNIRQSTRTTYDDDYKRMVNVSATDLETNAVYSRDIILEKTVERSHPDDRVVLGQRQNSAGTTVYIVQSTEEELLVKESAMVSRMFRTEALRFVPADTLEECEKEIILTVRTQDAKDPDAGRKSIADGFASLNVMPSDLKTYLGHELAQCSPAELADLRGLFSALREGQVTWAEVLAERAGSKKDEANGEPAKATTVAERIRSRQKPSTEQASQKESSGTGSTQSKASGPQSEASSTPVDGAGPSRAEDKPEPQGAEARSGDKPGETGTSAAPRQPTVAIDWGQKADDLKEVIADAKTDVQKAAARAMVKQFIEGFPGEIPPADVADDLRRFAKMSLGS
jgi:hypothetical protein